MTNYNKYFPLKLAKGNAFCNRVDERKILYSQIQSNQHTVIISPRRYGKSSLVLYTLNENNCLYERVDLFVAIDQKSIETLILNGCKNLINQLFNPIEKGIEIIKNYLKQAKLKWIVGSDGVRIELIPDKSIDAATTILQMLKLIDVTLEKVKTPATLFIDEFQEIGKLVDGKSIEGAIRHVAEQTEYLTFIFSGSSRHMLTQMFDDRNRPLYNLCERMMLPRIKALDYKKFLNKLAKKTFNTNLSDTIIEKILTLTERHPYYVNALCRRVWQYGLDTMPSVDAIDKMWLDYAEQEKSRTSTDLRGLSATQLKLLILIARGKNKELTSKDVLQSLDMSSSGATKALQILQKKDYIEIRGDEYQVIDPLIKFSICFYYENYM